MGSYRQTCEAVSNMIHVYHDYIKKADHKVDFEISIDETTTTKIPLMHFFVANELKLNGVKVTSLAPRFCGDTLIHHIGRHLKYLGFK